MKKSLGAFTLIELLVVITVIAILASIALPVFTSVQEKARITQDLSNLRQLGIATQTYLNDHDGILFTAGGIWMTELHPKYLPSWKIFQSPFDGRAATENDANAPISYGLNGTPISPNPNIAGLAMDKVVKPSVFILFAPAQDDLATVTFSGKPNAAVTVHKDDVSSGGTQQKRSRINALFADLHAESMTWKTFVNDTPNSTDLDAGYRWDPAGPPP